MPRPLVYFAYPIDLATGKHASSVTALQRQLHRAGWNVYEPGRAFDATGSPDPRVQEINLEALQRCDGLFVYWTGEATTGVPMEVGFARANGCPTVIYGTDLPLALALTPNDNHADRAIRRLEGMMAEPSIRPGVPYYLPPHSEMTLEPCVPLECACTEPLPFAGEGDLPTRGHHGDAGFDLWVTENTPLPPGQFTNVPAGLAVDLPDGVWGMIVGRSSTFFKRGLLVNTAVIDQGYRGPLFACVYNPGPQEQVAARGERLAQMIPLPVLADRLTPVKVQQVSESSRGDRGFGSTGY